ncbi:hypothetical protein F5Y19DRAFT_472715 [Xylariaceae sp. FL1651]|nr:hypothetical protein F5Y19DRAFT_472715 [Xylariaceae sp. FL1651]
MRFFDCQTLKLIGSSKAPSSVEDLISAANDLEDIALVVIDPAVDHAMYTAALDHDWDQVIQTHVRTCDGLDLWVGIGLGIYSHECRSEPVSERE